MIERDKLAIIAHHGQANLGDETATQALVQNLQRLHPGGEIVCFSLDPEDTASRFGVQSFAVRPQAEGFSPASVAMHSSGSSWTERSDAGQRRPSTIVTLLKRSRLVVSSVHLLRSLRATVAWLWAEVVFLPRSQARLNGTRLLVIAGSNQLLDNWGGAFGYPYALLRWVLQARLAGAKVAFVSIGAGPIDQRLSWSFICRALRLASYVSYRDAGSLALVRAHSDGRHATIRPDMAYSHSELKYSALPATSPASPPTIAVNPMPVNDPRYWPDSDPAAYNRYVASMVAAVRQLTERRYRVVFFSTHPSDEWVIDDIRAGLPADGIVEVVRPRDTATLAAFVRSADVVIATRFHGILFALACCRPVLGVCYYRKSRELMAAAGMEQFAIDIDTIDPSAIVAKVERLLEDAPMIVPQLALHAAMQRRELDTQYVQLVHLWAPELRSVPPAAHLPSDLDDGRREAR